jgi:hypothetical protein
MGSLRLFQLEMETDYGLLILPNNLKQSIRYQQMEDPLIQMDQLLLGII